MKWAVWSRAGEIEGGAVAQACGLRGTVAWVSREVWTLHRARDWVWCVPFAMLCHHCFAQRDKESVTRSEYPFEPLLPGACLQLVGLFATDDLDGEVEHRTLFSLSLSSAQTSFAQPSPNALRTTTSTKRQAVSQVRAHASVAAIARPLEEVHAARAARNTPPSIPMQPE